MVTSLSVKCSISASACARSIIAACVSTTPLGGPVVPEVKNRNASSRPAPRAASLQDHCSGNEPRQRIFDGLEPCRGGRCGGSDIALRGRKKRDVRGLHAALEIVRVGAFGGRCVFAQRL